MQVAEKRQRDKSKSSSPSPLLPTSEAKKKKKNNNEDEADARPFNHIRIASGGKLRGYCGYAMDLLTKAREEKQDGGRTVVLFAENGAVGKCVSVAELVKRKIGGLHQITTGMYGFGRIACYGWFTYRQVSSREKAGKEDKFDVIMQITLSLDAPKDLKTVGYQPPDVNQ